MEKTVKTNVSMSWEYESRILYGKCRIAEDELALTLTFSQRHSREFYDVCQMEWLLQQHLDATLTTTEEVAALAKELWPSLDITVKGMADSHGLITVRV